MFRTINRLRKASDAKKQRVILILSFGITGLIAVIWAVSLFMRLENGDLSSAFSLKDNPKLDASKEAVSNSWSQFLEGIDRVSRSFEDAASSTPPSPAGQDAGMPE